MRLQGQCEELGCGGAQARASQEACEGGQVRQRCARGRRGEGTTSFAVFWFCLADDFGPPGSRPLWSTSREGALVLPFPLSRDLTRSQILLLCGPPGLGKTTLAYVLARQAGYQVLEVNASDDRSGKIVEDRIRNALDSRALTGSGGLEGSKPTCVVIDEIDGAGGGGETVSAIFAGGEKEADA